jgi:hypothetical protein
MSRSLLALGGLGLLAVLGTACPGPYDLEEPPCYGSDINSCLGTTEELRDTAGTCEGTERRVCLVPLGAVPPDLINSLVAYFHEQYGLQINVAQPQPIPGDLVNGDRDQIEAHDLITQTYLGLPTDVSLDPQAVVIGLAGADLYTKDENWRYAFGIRGNYAEPAGVLSVCRMYLDAEGLASDLVLFRRASKMLSRYIGFLYYGLEPNDDPASPMYRSILSVGDLDRIQKPLPIGDQAAAP